MAYDAAEARQQLLDAIAEATDELGSALACLGAAYELLDENHGDELEQALFRPVQLAYGRAKRTHVGFAERHGLRSREFQPPPARLPTTAAKGLIDIAVESVDQAASTIATIQDSLMPVEVGDAQLRAGLAELRELVGGVRQRARELTRTLGR
jgi:hypothetical protein